MKVKGMRVALECVRGSVSTATDSVELNGQSMRVSDGRWWAEATLPEPIPTSLTLPYSKLRSIVKTLEEKEEMEIEPNGVKCLIKTSAASWELTLLSIPPNLPPEFEAKAIIEVSGYQLLDAYKPLRHLISLDLSDPGLMWAWTNENQELVVGSGYAFGAYPIEVEGLEIPLMALMEIGRILAVRQSEKVSFKIREQFLSVAMRDFHFQTTLPSGPKFKPDWYANIRKKMTEDSQVLKTSRSSLKSAIDLVGVTAGESKFTLDSSNGALILASMDDRGNKSTVEIQALGTLRGPIILDLNHVIPILDALNEEMISLTVFESSILFSDKDYWEILMRIG